MSSFNAHVKPVIAMSLIEKDGVEYYGISADKAGETKVWNVAHLLNPEIEIKKPLMVYTPKDELVTSLSSMGHFMSLPIFGMGTSTGNISLVAIAPGTKSKEMVIGSWQASPVSGLKQIERMEESGLVATMDSQDVRLWKFFLSDDGIKEDLKATIDKSNFSDGVETQHMPTVIEWTSPHNEISIGYQTSSRVNLFDVNKLRVARSLNLKENAQKIIKETTAVK